MCYSLWYNAPTMLPAGGRQHRGCNFPTCVLDGHLHRVTHTRCRIDTIDSPDDDDGVARNM